MDANMQLKLALLLALAALPSMAESAPNGRAPTDKWSVNFEDAQCLAVRNYGIAQNQIQLILKVPAIGGVVQVTVVKRGPRAEASQVRGWVTIDDRPPSKANFLTYTPGSSEYRVYVLNMRAADFALVRQASALSFQIGEVEERFALSHMEPLLKIVDDCVTDLRRIFNITDPEAAANSPLKQRATANLARFFTGDEYPDVAVGRGQSGTVKFALLLNEHGRVADCSIIGTSGVASLDSQTCATLKARAIFQPALGLDGKPAKDAVVGRITWRL
jgi:TonB family protein